MNVIKSNASRGLIFTKFNFIKKSEELRKNEQKIQNDNIS